MPKQKLSAKDVQAAEAASDEAQVRAIFKQLGRSLSLTIMTALSAPGGLSENSLIAAQDAAWESLASLIIKFAKEEDNHAQSL